LDPAAWIARADVLERQFRWAEAEEALAEELRLDPYRIDVYLERAWISIWNGRPAEALVELDRVASLNPREAGSGEMLFARCRAELSLGRYDDAIRSCERSVTLDNNWVTYMFLTAAYAQRGEMTEALRAKAQLLKLLPGVTISGVKAMRISDNADFWAQTETHVFSGLRKAGVPER
jgi:tetratricopeptide (TPR) repeat protein